MMNIEFLWDSLNNQAQLINHEYTNKNIFFDKSLCDKILEDGNGMLKKRLEKIKKDHYKLINCKFFLFDKNSQWEISREPDLEKSVKASSPIIGLAEKIYNFKGNVIERKEDNVIKTICFYDKSDESSRIQYIQL